MCSRKNKREVVFAKRRISTAYSLVAVIVVLQFLSSRYVKDITRFKALVFMFLWQI